MYDYLIVGAGLYGAVFAQEAKRAGKSVLVIDKRPHIAGNVYNKKVKILARKSALSYKAQESAIVMLEDFTFEAPKTKEFLSIIKNLKIEGKKVLFVLPESNKNVYLSARNLQRAEVVLASNVNSYKVLNADVVVITEKSLETIDQILTK